MKKLNFLLLILLCLILISCSQMMSSSDSKFFVQQQSQSNKDGSIGGPNVDWGDDDGDGSGSGGAPPELAAGQISIFSVLQADGFVLSDAVQHIVDTGKMGGADASYNGYDYKTAKFATWEVLSNFTSANVPNLWYGSDNKNWGAPSGDGTNMQSVTGPSTTAGSNSITDMRYYRYVGVNPFFAHDSTYNTAKYLVYDEDMKTDKEEKLMERFIFYRFTGKGGGVAALDNMLVAVDTYTKLVFSFAKPTKWGSLLGNAVPLEWGPVDLVSTGPGGKKYKFYEYDPAGYVTEDGKFHMTDDYRNNLGAGNFDPDFTGKSPYLVTINEDGTGGGGGGGETGYAVSGTLTVKAKYIENVSMTDAWGDAGSADGSDSPEFIYSVRSRAYVGFNAGEWDVMSSYKPDDTDISPRGAKRIQKGTTLQLGGGTQYKFNDTKEGLTLELDNRIIEIDITGNDNLTDYETPVIFLGYDRYSQKWTPKADNATYLRGPLEYDENFQVGLGETKDFIVTVPAGSGETLKLCYEISWETDSSMAGGRIVSAQTENIGTDPNYLFSGSNGEYDISYIDLIDESSKKAKTVSIEISLGNLHPEVPIVVNYAITNEVSGFIGKPTFGGYNSANAILTADEPTLHIKIPLGFSPATLQTGTLTLKFSDSSGNLKTYDTTHSLFADGIKIDIKRDKFIPTNDATLEISNVKLKNLSVMDVGGDQPAGGYDQPEFSWSIKTRHNSAEWNEFSANGDSNVIKTGQTLGLSGEVSHEIVDPREGEQIVYFSAAITEIDGLAGNANDVIMKHEEPLIQIKYNPLSDSWNLGGQTSFYFTDGSDMQWQIKKITMNDVKRTERTDDKDAQTVTISISSYIGDTIWPTDSDGFGWITDIIAGPTTAGWGDMELTFDVTWRAK